MFVSYSPVDPCIEALVVRGALEARRFLSGLEGATSIEWESKEAQHPDPNRLSHRCLRGLLFSLLLMAAAPVLLVLLALKKCSSSFNAFLRRGIGVTGEYSLRSQLAFGGLTVALGYALGWQAKILVLCGAATMMLVRLHDAKE